MRDAASISTLTPISADLSILRDLPPMTTNAHPSRHVRRDCGRCCIGVSRLRVVGAAPGQQRIIPLEHQSGCAGVVGRAPRIGARGEAQGGKWRLAEGARACSIWVLTSRAPRARCRSRPLEWGHFWLVPRLRAARLRRGHAAEMKFSATWCCEPSPEKAGTGRTS